MLLIKFGAVIKDMQWILHVLLWLCGVPYEKDHIFSRNIAFYKNWPFERGGYICTLDILFSSNHNTHKSSYDLCFWASDSLIERFSKIFRLKGLKPKIKDHTNFYECCDLTEIVYLVTLITNRMWCMKPKRQFFTFPNSCHYNISL